MMYCPQCQSSAIDDSGECPVCGYRISEGDSDPETGNPQNTSPAGIIAIDYAERAQDPAPEDERPQWRQDLSRRLRAIKQKREEMGVSQQPGNKGSGPGALSRKTPAEPPRVISSARFIEGAPPRRPAPKPRTPAPRQKILQPLTREKSPEKPPGGQQDTREIQDLIDNAVSIKAKQSEEFFAPAGIFSSMESQPPEYEGKLILLSRTLCGLVDLLIVLLCTGMLILSADFFSGIIALDAISYLHFSILFLLTYLFYSLFFLASTSQTIGMMITELRVVGICDERPSIGQLIRRCWAFLLSLFGLGFGLVWGLFDRESLCFHDRISDTRVERI
ncbi:MAG: RDD family protein [Acidobacteria bacterium]|nr:RDD family protein [Acidobacteriota bacterium]